MSISGLRKASWYNPDTGTVVQANNLAEDGEFYTRAIEDPDDQTPTGESPYAGDESYCELMVFDMSLLPQLQAWEETDTRISMVAAGVQQNIQWYERDLLSVKPVYPVAAGRRNHINVTMERTGHGAHDIYGHVNLLAHLGTTADPWTDEDGDDLAKGYSLANTSDRSFFDSKQYYASKNNGLSSVLQNDSLLVFPIEGVSITLSTEIIDLHSENNQIKIRLRSFQGSTISVSTDSFDSKGRKKISKSLTNGAYQIRTVIHKASNSTVEDGVETSNPALRVDGSDQYVSY